MKYTPQFELHNSLSPSLTPPPPPSSTHTNLSIPCLSLKVYPCQIGEHRSFLHPCNTGKARIRPAEKFPARPLNNPAAFPYTWSLHSSKHQLSVVIPGSFSLHLMHQLVLIKSYQLKLPLHGTEFNFKQMTTAINFVVVAGKPTAKSCSVRVCACACLSLCLCENWL